MKWGWKFVTLCSSKRKVKRDSSQTKRVRGYQNFYLQIRIRENLCHASDYQGIICSTFKQSTVDTEYIYLEWGLSRVKYVDSVLRNESSDNIFEI